MQSEKNPGGKWILMFILGIVITSIFFAYLQLISRTPFPIHTHTFRQKTLQNSHGSSDAFNLILNDASRMESFLFFYF